MIENISSAAGVTETGAELGFYKGGCPIHLKGAPEVKRQRRRGGEVWGGAVHLCTKIFVFLISNGEFLCTPSAFIDTVTFKKGTLIKRAGVQTPWTPDGSTPGFLLADFMGQQKSANFINHLATP